MSASTSEAPPDGSASAVHAALQRRWLLWRAQKMAFWVLYDFAGALVCLNLVTWLVVALPSWLVSYLVPGWPWPSLAVAGVLGTLAMAGQANLIAGLLEEKEFSVYAVWRGAVQSGAKALILAAVLLLSMFISGLGVWFYLTHLATAGPWAGWILASLCGGSGGIVLLAAQFWLPALVHKQGSAVTTMRTGLVLVARHPVLALAMLLVSGGTILVLATPPGVLLMSTLPVVALYCCVYELLARWYALKEAVEYGASVPASLLDENDIFLNRGFTDLLQPWKL